MTAFWLFLFEYAIFPFTGCRTVLITALFINRAGGEMEKIFDYRFQTPK
jgi:hypothetical protein